MIKSTREEGHYTIKRVKRLPKRGNANWLYAIIGTEIEEFYRWDVYINDYERVTLGGSSISVQAGTNVTITGTGTTADPYIFNSTGAQVVETDTTISGDGTVGDPLSVVFPANPDGSETIVQQGTNVTITGSGTIANPYIVNSTSAGGGDGSETKVTEGTNITITGTGTIADPYIINSTDTIADGSETIVTQGTNVTVTGAGTSASPYVINATASGTGLENIVEDTTPQLGGDLDLNSNLITSVSPITTSNTNAVISLETSGGNLCNMGVGNANSNTTYTLSNTTIINGNAQVFVNAASEPSVTGAVKEIGMSFIPNTDLYLNVVNRGEGRIVYFFSPNLIVANQNIQDLVINQIAHGLVIGDAIRHNGTSYVKAQANLPVNSGVLGIVTNVVDVNNFKYQFSGIYTQGSWTNGTDYFLSNTTAGAVITEPTYTVGEVRTYIGTGISEGLLINIDIGNEITNEEDKIEEDNTVTGTKDVDWSKETFLYTLTGNCTFSDINLPVSGINSKVITLHVTGAFTPTWSAGWITYRNGTYDGLKFNTIIVEFIKTGVYKMSIIQQD